MTRELSRNSSAMPTNAPGTAARAAFAALIDYAGLFPPAQLEPAQALLEYRSARAGAFAWMLGRFIVSASRLDEIRALGADAIPLSIIVDAGTDSRTWLSNVQRILANIAAAEPEALEIALPPLLTGRETYDAAIGQFAAAVQQAGLGRVPAFVEFPQDERLEKQLAGAMYALARHRLGAKIRCGGAVAQAVPSPGNVALFLTRAHEERVPFKATAGLHHPVRHFNGQSGFTMHGFLNVIAAAAFAQQDRPAEQLASVLADEDATHFGIDSSGLRWIAESIPTAAIETMRRTAFISYGSCSFTEPIEDLRHLELL